MLHEEALGGASISLLRCIPGLEQRGWRFDFFVPRPSTLFDHLQAGDYRVSGATRTIAYSLRALRLEPGPARRLAAMPTYLRSFQRAIRSPRPAVVHANSLTTLAEAALTRLAGIPTVFHIHEMIRSGRKADLTRRAVRRAGTEVVAVSEACADGLAVNAYRPRVVYGGAPIPREAVAIRDRTRFVVGTIGVLSRRKGTDTFVEAARLLRRTRKDIDFVLVGAPTDPLDAPWAVDLLRQVRETGITHHQAVDVAGELPNWDVFVLPSRTDPFPVVILEAMAAGLPVVASDVDGIPEQIGDAGRLVPAENPSALARAIAELADSPRSERAALGAAARERVIRRFTIEQQVEGLDQAYLSAVGARR